MGHCCVWGAGPTATSGYGVEHEEAVGGLLGLGGLGQ